MPRNKYHDTPVVEFHEAFGAPVAWEPAVPPEERVLLRLSLILEEFKELLEACGYSLSDGPNAFLQKVVAGEGVDLVAVADALTDLRYVIDGACLEFGLPAEKLLREVHRSNMSKLGPDGKPLLREDGKILKGPNYTPPQIALLLELYTGVKNG